MSENDSEKAKSAPAKSNADRVAKPSTPAGGYSIGYGRPPVASQFKKGRSGNISGRPRDSRNIATIMEELLCRKQNVVIGGKAYKMSGSEIVAHGVFKEASKGDLKAFDRIVEMQAVAAKAKRVATKITSDMSAVEASNAYQRLIKGTDID